MIQREHKSQYYNNENLRHLQRQINELWEVIDRRVEDVAPPTTENLGSNEVIDEVVGPLALNPQPFKVVPTGRGWYQVVDSEGKATHEGKLRRDAADEACKTAMEGA